MSGFLRRSLPNATAYLAVTALTGALLLLCAFLQPGASIHLWFLFGTVAASVGGVLVGALGAILSAVTTIAAVDYFAVKPVGAFGFPRAASEIAAFITFIVASAVIVRLSHLKDAARRQIATTEVLARSVEHDARRRRLLLRLTERAVAGGSLEALCRDATDATTEALDIRFCAVLEPQANDQGLTVVASSGWPPADVHRLAVLANVDSQVGYALLAGDPVIVADTDVEQKFVVPAEFRMRGARSGIAVRIGSIHSFGVLVAYDASPRRLDDAVIEFVRGIAAMLAAAYERSHLERERADFVARDAARREETQLTARRAAFLAHTASVLDAALDPETTLVSLARVAVPTVADCSVVDLVEDDARVRRIDVVDVDPVRRNDADALRRLTPDLRNEGPFPRAIRTGQPVLLPDLSKVTAPTSAEGDHLRALTRLGCQSLLLIPLVARGQTLGLLTLGSRIPSRYDGADLSLAQELASRAAIALDNGRLHREAQAASRAKDEFLATVSHELRTPLNAVLGWAAILRRQPFDDARAQQALAAIERSVHAQAGLLEQLLDISRIVSGKFELRLGPVRLDDVVAAAVDAVRPAADERQIHIDQNIDSGLPAVTGDSDRLQQVVINLLSNAIKFTHDEGIVDIELRAGEEATAEILVRDRGVGIPRDFLPYVFERFRQSVAATRVSTKGLGLGLAIVKEIVERHGGSVRAESAGEGKGATFRVNLPLEPIAEKVGVWHHRPAPAAERIFKPWTPEPRE